MSRIKYYQASFVCFLYSEQGIPTHYISIHSLRIHWQVTQHCAGCSEHRIRVQTSFPCQLSTNTVSSQTFNTPVCHLTNFKHNKGNRCGSTIWQINYLEKCASHGLSQLLKQTASIQCSLVLKLMALLIPPWDSCFVFFFITPVQCTSLAHKQHLKSVSWINDIPQGPHDLHLPELSLIFNSSLFSACALKVPEIRHIFNKDLQNNWCHQVQLQGKWPTTPNR